MKLPVQFAPHVEVGFIAERGFVGFEDLLGPREVFFSQTGNGLAQDRTFKRRADVKEFLNLIRRECRDYGTTMVIDRNQSFSFKLAKRFPHWNPADSKLGGDGLLAQLLTRTVVASEDFIAQPVGDSGRQGLPLDSQMRIDARVEAGIKLRTHLSDLPQHFSSLQFKDKRMFHST